MTQNAAHWAYWRKELREPGQSRDTTEFVAGFYRGEGARTKPDYPVAIWYEADGSPSVKIGRQEPQTGHARLEEFMTEPLWFKCKAVDHDEYIKALDTGMWSDGKESRKTTAEEKLDIIPDTPREEGGNMVDEDGEPVDQFWLQIKTKLEKARAAIADLGKIDTEDKANKLAAQIDILSEAGKLGEAKRKVEKAPHDTAAAAVQTKWVPVLQPASDAIKAAKEAIDAFQKSERARLQAIKDEEARIERERLQAIKDAEAEAERVRLQAIADEEAAAKGQTAEAIEVVAEKVEVVAETVAAPRVSSTYGRAITKAVVRRGKITDEAKFIKAIKGGDDFKEFLQTKANALARAKTKVAGMEIEEI